MWHLLTYKRAFDSIDRELLEYRPLNSGIDGNFYHAVKSLYKITQSYVRLEEGYTDRFDCNKGMRQGDNLSSTLFALYINDLAVQVKALNKGIQIDDYDLVFCCMQMTLL